MVHAFLPVSQGTRERPFCGGESVAVSSQFLKILTHIHFLSSQFCACVCVERREATQDPTVEEN